MGQKELMLLDWMRKIHQLEYAHCFQSIYYSNIEKFTGISAFVLSTLVAFTYRFPFIHEDIVKSYILPFILLIIAILTGYQTFIKPGEKAETHRKLGIEYEKNRHEIEKVLTNFNQISNVDDTIANIKSKWDSINTLYVSMSKYNEAKNKVKSFKKYPKELGFLPDND
jgi:hypothetical protein